MTVRRAPCIDGCGTITQHGLSRTGRCRDCADKRRFGATPRTRQRMLAAIEMPTFQDAKEAYGSADNNFWRAVRKCDLEAVVREKYAFELEAARQRRLAKTREAAAKGREVANAQAEARKIERDQALIEDGEFLARLGEHPSNAARRLGYKNTLTLERALDRVGRHDIMARLWENDGLHDRLRDVA
jgi:hypothetical protein